MIRKPTVEVYSLKTGYTVGEKSVVVSSDVNEKLYSGELTCLLGPNGSGKSTILKTLSAFIPPLSGDIRVDGKYLTDYTPSELAKIIGVVLTDRLSVDNMKVEELVSMGRAPYTGFWGKLTDHDREMVNESISLVKIEDLRGRLVHTLSDGERQKVMIAKALAQETPVIFLDEPTAFLDYPSKAEILQLLQRLSRVKQKTVFLSTHDLELALQTADKVWLIDKRYGVKTGSPEDLALSGEMGKYFEREGMIFDPESGLFKIHTPHSRSVCVVGNGIRRNMIEKSLARNGFAISDNTGNPIIIKIEDNGYSINGYFFTTIEDLTNKVCSLLS